MTIQWLILTSVIVSAISICGIARSDDCSTQCKLGGLDCARTSSADNHSHHTNPLAISSSTLPVRTSNILVHQHEPAAQRRVLRPGLDDAAYPC